MGGHGDVNTFTSIALISTDALLKTTYFDKLQISIWWG